MAVDHILFAIDYPFVPNEPGPEWMKKLTLNSEDNAQVLHGNEERILNL